MSLYRLLLRSLRRSTTTQPLTSNLVSHVPNPEPPLQVRNFAFSSAEEAAAERRRRKRRLRIEPPLNAIRAQPQPRERDPNAPRLPDTTSALTGPRLNLHNRVQSLIRAGDLDAASTVARHSVFSSTRPTVFTCNAIIAAMYRAKRYKDAIALFHFFFNQSNIVPNVVSYNNLINTHCDEGDVDKALEVYRHILENAPFSPSWVTYQHLTKGLVSAGRIDEGVDLLREMLNKGGGADSLVYNNLISGFLELGNLEKANELFDELKERCLVYNGVVNATFMEWYFKQGRDKEAMESYRSWLAREFTTVPATCNVLLEVLLKWGKEKEAWELFEKMLDDHKPPNSQAVNSDTFNLMVNECFKHGKFSEALETFKKVGTHAKSKPFAMDVAGYNNIISRYCENGMLTEAETLFDELCSKALSPDATTHKTLIDAYLKFERIDDALKILNRMVDQGLRVVASFGSRVFDELIKNGKVIECAQVLSKMGERDPKPDAMCYEVVVKGLCNADVLDKAYDVLDECLRHGVGFTSTLQIFVKEAFEKAGRGPEIDKLLNMSKWGYVPRQSPQRPPTRPLGGFHHQSFAPSPVTGQHSSQLPPGYSPPNSPSGSSPGMVGLHASQSPPSWGQYNSSSGPHHTQASSQIDRPPWVPPPQMRAPHQPSPMASPRLSETYYPPSGFPTQTNGTCQPPLGHVPLTPHHAPAGPQQTQWSSPSQFGSQQPQQTPWRTASLGTGEVEPHAPHHAPAGPQQTQWSTPSQLGGQQPQQTSWRTASQGAGQVPEQTAPQLAAPQMAAQQQTPWRNPHQMVGQLPQQTPRQMTGQQQMQWGSPPQMAGQRQTSWGNPTHMVGEQHRSWENPPHVTGEQQIPWGNPPQVAGQQHTWINSPQMAEQQPRQMAHAVPPEIPGQVVHQSSWNSTSHLAGESASSRLSSPMSRSSPSHCEVHSNTPVSNDPTSGTSSTYKSSEHSHVAEEVAA